MNVANFLLEHTIKHKKRRERVLNHVRKQRQHCSCRGKVSAISVMAHGSSPASPEAVCYTLLTGKGCDPPATCLAGSKIVGGLLDNLHSSLYGPRV